MELALKHRPKTLDEVVGQPEAVSVIKGFGKRIPHTIMLTGLSGSGKTSCARILARLLKCPPEDTMNYAEENTASWESPLDSVRAIERGSTLHPIGSPCRVYVLDELQSLTRASASQNALLKILEDSNEYCYFILCTTDPQKIIAPIRGRCVQIALKEIPGPKLKELLKRVAKAEGKEVADDVLSRITELAGGSARNALQALESVIGLDPAERMGVLLPKGSEKVAFDLVRALDLYGGKANWRECAKVLDAIEDESAEGLRLMIVKSARSALLKRGASIAARVIRSLRDPYYDATTGHALLAADLYAAVHAKS